MTWSGSMTRVVEWKSWCTADDLTISDDLIDVRLPHGRHHRVEVEVRDDSYRLAAKIAPRSVLATLSEPELAIWSRNRSVQIVGFRIDRYDRVIGEVIAPRDEGLDEKEFCFLVRTLATECDRLEVLLTGDDNE